MASESMPEDLLLIMQSYVDPIPPPTTSPAPSKPIELSSKAPIEIAEDEWSEGEDVVEAAIAVESDDEDIIETSNSTDQHTTKTLSSVNKPTDNPSSDSDSDSDSDSSSSSDVEMRVTRYPSSKSKHGTLTVLMKTSESDAEDEEGGPHGVPNQYSGTKNEILVPDVDIPEIAEVPTDDVLEPIGEIMAIIDSVVVVKGNTTGVYQALDTDSLLVFEDRKVLGKVFETFGAVKQPLYSVRFPSASAIDKDVVWIGRPVSHVPSRSNFVFTAAIARIKGSDASNLHDEEVGEDQLDFSDDEAEAQWRRNRKEVRREQGSSYGRTRSPPGETSTQSKPELPPPVLQYPAGDDGDVPYSALPYDEEPDPRPTPAAYDPYSDHEDSKPVHPVPPRPQPSGSHQARSGRGRGRDQNRGGPNRNQNRRDRKNVGPSDRGRPGRGRDGRGRGRGGRQHHGQGNPGFFGNQYFGELSPTSHSMAQAAGQHHSVQYGQDEGYNPMNSGTGIYDPEPGTMPHINPRFFSNEMGGNMSGFGLPWGDMSNMAGYGYGYQPPGFGYGGFGQGEQMAYNNQNYGWPSGEQHGSQDPPHE